MTGKGLREVLTRVFDLERSRPNPRGEGQEPSAALRNRVRSDPEMFAPLEDVLSPSR